MTIQDIIERKAKFIGKILSVTVGFNGESLKNKTISDIQLWENAIMFVFSDDPGGEIVLPQEEIRSISGESDEFFFWISSPIYSCGCRR